MSKERDHQLHDAVIQHAIGNLKASNAAPLTDANKQCVQRAAKMGVELNKKYIGELRLRPLRPNIDEATREIAERYRDAFANWSKDDLLWICSWIHACNVAQGLRDHGLI